MRKKSTECGWKSSPRWEGLEPWIRGQIQSCFQDVLEEDVAEFLGRAKYERRSAIDGVSGSRNGFGKPRNLTMSCGGR